MGDKAKFIFPILATGIIVFGVSCVVVTLTNIRLRAFPYARPPCVGNFALLERA